MRLVLFPTAVGVLVVVAWLLVTLIEECLFHSGDPKFDCRSSLEIAAVFATLGGVLAALAAGVARALLQPWLSFETLVPELVSAALASSLLVLLFYAIIHWEVPIGRAAGMLFFWPIAGFLISGASLILVRRLGRGPS